VPPAGEEAAPCRSAEPAMAPFSGVRGNACRRAASRAWVALLGFPKAILISENSADILDIHTGGEGLPLSALSLETDA
jgi:hypothetical protein